MSIQLSIILPVFNTENFVKEAIESILGQTFTDFELLIVDDASTDSTSQIINQFKNEPRVSIFRNSANLGKNTSVNRLIDKCEGKYLTIHDADDLSHHQRFERQISTLERDRDLVMCGCSFYSINAKNQVLGTTSTMTDYESIKKQIISKSCFHGPTMIFEKKLINELGGLYRRMKMGEDIDFTMRVAEQYKCYNVDELLYAYRIIGSSVTKSLNYSMLNRQIDHDLIYFLAEQRRASKEFQDSLMRNEKEIIAQKITEITDKFYENEPEHLRFRLGYLLSQELYKNATLFALKYFLLRKKVIYLKELLYTVKVSLTYLVTRPRLFKKFDDIHFLFGKQAEV